MFKSENSWSKAFFTKPTLSWIGVIVAVFIGVMITYLAGLVTAYTQNIMMNIAINIILSVGLNLVVGYAGQFSLGHAGFMAIGAYSAAIVTQKVTDPMGRFISGDSFNGCDRFDCWTSDFTVAWRLPGDCHSWCIRNYSNYDYEPRYNKWSGWNFWNS